MKEIKGDITEVKSGVLIQQVNCMGAMGAGVALAILKKWPRVREEYIMICSGYAPEKLFGLLYETELEPGLTLVNSFTQFNYGGDVKHTDEEKLIANIKAAAETYPEREVYIPKLIGCGLAGGDWPTVYEGIKDIDNLTIVEFN